MKFCLIFCLVQLLLGFTAWGDDGFSHESELGWVVTGGNSEVETLNVETANNYGWLKNEVKGAGHYTLGSANQQVSTRNWHGELRYDRVLHYKLNIYVGERVEGDKFAGYESRYNSDLGFKYTFSKRTNRKTFAEVGYRYTIEKRLDPVHPEVKQHKGRVYLEHEHNANKNMFYKLWVEFLPNFTDSTDYMIRFEPSLRFKINSALSLKLAYKGTYDNFPAVNGNKKYDYIYTTALLAKF